jgi:hypothetical protein
MSDDGEQLGDLDAEWAKFDDWRVSTYRAAGVELGTAWEAVAAFLNGDEERFNELVGGPEVVLKKAFVVLVIEAVRAAGIPPVQFWRHLPDLRARLRLDRRM